MTSQTGKKTVATHILPNISRSKGNQRMAFGQLIEYNMRNVFLEESYTKCGGETIPRPFSKKSKLLFFMPSCGLQLSCRPLAFISNKYF